MSDTVAIALISSLPVSTVAVVALLVNFSLDQRRRLHEQEQLARQLDHDRETRLLEWKRQDRLDRLAPLREFLDAFSRQLLNVTLERPGEDDLEGVKRSSAALAEMEAVIKQSGHVVWRSPDEETMRLMHVLLDRGRQAISATPEGMDELMKQVWDRLEEIQSDL